ncbi:MAG TPA: DUF1801 domain-containing protein [Mycobacteriales bacterium]|nr:DUF1801 domain-containing protein [Mycobacteriales bacterium]
MPKHIKGLAGRKPPEPLADRSAIDEWIPGIVPGMQPIVRRLDELIRETVPGLRYAFKRGRPYYGLPEQGWIIEIAAYFVSVNVLFYGGADFDDPPPLGTTDRTRYVKVASLDEIDQPQLKKWIKEAARTPGWK